MVQFSGNVQNIWFYKYLSRKTQTRERFIYNKCMGRSCSYSNKVSYSTYYEKLEPFIPTPLFFKFCIWYITEKLQFQTLYLCNEKGKVCLNARGRVHDVDK